MDKQQFESENLDESMPALCIIMEIRTFKLLHKPRQLQRDQIIAVNWIPEKKNRLVKGGLLSDDCSTANIRPCCVLEKYCSPH